MLWLRGLSCLLLGGALFMVGASAGDKKAKDDVGKDAPTKDKEEIKKDPAKDPRAVKGKVDSVNLKASSFILDVGAKDKDLRTFMVSKKTEFWGPRGAKGEGLKDDRMEKGYEIIVIPADDGKVALEVHLPYRKPPEEKKKDKGAAKEKKK